MGWLLKNRSKSAKNAAARKSTNLAPKPDFRAIKVKHGKKVCSAASEIADKVFLCNEAPLLPLSDCNKGYDCSCRYLHLDDRRQGPRREVDIGLPMQRVGTERRNTNDRRRSQLYL